MSSRSRRLESAGSAPRPQGGGLAHGIIPGALIALAIVGAGLWFIGRSDSSDDPPATSAAVASQPESSIPQFVSAAPDRVREAYEFAATHGVQLAYIPCYCGCGGHSGHRNVRDCFIKSASRDSITYEEHGSQCDICVSIVLDTKAMLARGDSLAMVRATIDQDYADVGPGTDTPLPPGMEE